MSVTLAYPFFDRRELASVVRAARSSDVALNFTVDSTAGLALLSEVLEQGKEEQERPEGHDLWIKIDVGLGRCGVGPDTRAASPLMELARACLLAQGKDSQGLRLRGLLSHAGQSYGASGPEECTRIAREEARTLRGLRQELEQELKLDLPLDLSVGATPTDLARDAEGAEGIAEWRPGNFVFMDRTPLRLGLAKLTDVALTVLATVVSVNERHIIIDAGSKVLSSDLGAHGGRGTQGHGLVFPAETFEEDCRAWAEASGAPKGAQEREGGGLSEAAGASQGPGTDPELSRKRCPSLPGPMLVTNLSEEHGWIAWKRREVSPGQRLEPGDRVRVIPNHSCPVANLSDEYVAILDDLDGLGDGSAPLPEQRRQRRQTVTTTRITTWPIEARGAIARNSTLLALGLERS